MKDSAKVQVAICGLSSPVPVGGSGGPVSIIYHKRPNCEHTFVNSLS